MGDTAARQSQMKSHSAGGETWASLFAPKAQARKIKYDHIAPAHGLW